MKKKVLVVSALYRSRAVDQYRWVRFAGGCLVVLSRLFRVAESRTVFFFRLISCQFITSVLARGSQRQQTHRLWAARRVPNNAGRAPSAEQCIDHQLPQHIKVARDSFGSNKVCQFFGQNLLFMAQAVRK